MRKCLPVFFVSLLSIFLAIAGWSFTIPDTGQTESYTDTFGEDSDYLINPPSYTKLDAQGDELPDDAEEWAMVRDNVTGLIWEVKTTDGSIHDKENTCPWTDFSDGQNEFTAELNAMGFGGFSDWRIPTIRELVSIVDYDQFNPAINTSYFPNIVSTSYSSSTPAASVQGGFLPWHCGFISGNFSHLFASNHYIRGVRGGAEAIANFVDNGNGTITDKSKGLIWQKETPDSTMDWNASITYCENMTLAGYDDWRLPTIKELNSIVDYGQFNPAINSEIFPYTASDKYWSSTTYIFENNKAWAINFEYGSATPYDKGTSYNVRAVRVNKHPSADAGPDQAVTEGETVTLDASNSTDLDDGIASYLWTQTGGTSVTLSDTTAVHPTFTAPNVGTEGATLTFQLTVSDNGGLQDTDTVVINISNKIIAGDVDDSGTVDVSDAVMALQVSVGVNPNQTVYNAADVNGDNNIGLEEVSYILQKVAGLRE